MLHQQRHATFLETNNIILQRIEKQLQRQQQLQQQQLQQQREQTELLKRVIEYLTHIANK